jgi:hypothetical protein
MKNSKVAGIAAAGVIASLVLGSIGVASAATQSVSTTSGATTTATATAPAGQHRGPGGTDQGGKPGFGGIGDIGEAVANLTGLSVSDVEAKRAPGTRYAEIAKAKGVDADAVLAETIQIEKAELAGGVKDSTLTSAES